MATHSLNYHHLFYFWMIVQEGGVARAGERLRLSHSTLSAQLRMLEDSLEGQLFERRGRRLVLTPFGAEVAGYAGDIFRLGTELVELARSGAHGRRSPLKVGVVGTMPRSIAHGLLEPGLRVEERGPLSVRQDTLSRLVEELGAGRLHVVLSDALPDTPGVRLHRRLLGETAILLYGTKDLARRYRPDFPASLQGAPMLLPGAGALRRAIDRWLAERDIRVHVEGEIDDAALLRVIGSRGLGLFPVRAALRAEMKRIAGTAFVGPVEGVRERYYALSLDRRIHHPAVGAIVEQAGSQFLHAPTPGTRASQRAAGRSTPAPRA